MRALIQWFRALSRTKKFLLIAAVFIVVGIIIHQRSRTTPANTGIVVTRGSIDQTVSVTGSVTPTTSVDLSFQSSGRIARADFKVGDRVTAGQVLASLDAADLDAQLRNAQATVAAQQAKLDGLVAGSRPEDIAVAQAQADKAQQDLESAYSGVYPALLQAYSDTDNAVRVQTGTFFTRSGSGEPPQFILSFSCATCGAAITTVTQQRSAAEISLDQWKTELDTINVGGSPAAIEQALADARTYVQSASDLLAGLSSLLNSGNLTLPAATIQADVTSVNTAATAVAGAISAIDSQRQAIASQKLVVPQYDSALALKKAGSSATDIASQRASVQAAQAQVDSITAQINKGIIKSPIAGIITVQDAKVGQNATANAALISVISDQQLEIQADVPEVDIGKIAVGDAVSLTVDALPGETLMAHVTFVDPGETIIDGVVNFKVTMQLDQPDPRLKSGLTVNLDIQTIHKDGVLILPQYAIIENDQGTFVNKITGSTTTQIPVVLGILSKEGNVEVVSGVQEGDTVQNIGLKQ